MSKSIQESLDLPVLEDLLKNQQNVEGDEDDPEITDELIEQFEDDQKLNEVTTALESGLVPEDVVEARREREHEQTTTTIYKEAMQHAKDLMDLGYNVDTRSAGRIFENAANMFKIALESTNARREATLKQQKIQIEKRKIDLAERQYRGDKGNDGAVDSESVVVEDRNELIKRLREQASKKDK